MAANSVSYSSRRIPVKRSSSSWDESELTTWMNPNTRSLVCIDSSPAYSAGRPARRLPMYSAISWIAWSALRVTSHT